MLQFLLKIKTYKQKNNNSLRNEMSILANYESHRKTKMTHLKVKTI